MLACDIPDLRPPFNRVINSMTSIGYDPHQLYLMLVHDREPVEWHEICFSLKSYKHY